MFCVVNATSIILNLVSYFCLASLNGYICHFPHGKREFVIYCKEQDTSCIKTSWLKMIWHARYFPLLSSTKADSEGHLYGWLWDRLVEAHKHLLLMSQLSTENKKRIYRRLRTMYMSIRAINRKYSMRAYHVPGYTPPNGISHI